MKTLTTRLLIAGVAALVALSPDAFAQRQLGKKKGPTSKLYIAESTGSTQIKNGDKIYTASQASAFDAPGTVIETSSGSQASFVYSNGVGMTVGENTRLEINRFDQAAFTASSTNGVDEPSSSQSEVYVSRGSVGLVTSKLATGSTMAVTTPLGSIKIRGGNIQIETTDDVTVFSLLDGAATVYRGENDGVGTVLNPGEQIVLRRAPNAKLPLIQTGPIPRQQLPLLTAFLATAGNARNTVSFEMIEQRATQGLDNATGPAAGGSPATGGGDDTSAGADAGQEIVARPTVPANLPTNVVISPDRLTGG